MKSKLILFLLAMTAVASLLIAADPSYLGGRTQLTPSTLHADTNFFVAVRGSSTNAPYANVSPSNVLAKLSAMGIPKTTNVPAGAMVYVDAIHGSDTTGARTNLMRPFQSITAAKNAAASGDTIVVRPGTYNEFSLLKNGVSYFLEPGVKITNYTANARGGFGIFDDRTNGPVVCSIWGAGDVIIGGDPFTTNFGGAFVITNKLSQVNAKLNSIRGSWPGGTANQSFSALVLKDGTNRFVIDTIDSENFNDWQEVGNEGWNGIYWEDGEHFVDVRYMRVDGYCYWGEEPDRRATNNIYMTGDKWYSASAALYHDGASTSTPELSAGWKAWAVIKEIHGSVSCYTGGKQYVVTEKLDAASLAAEVSGNGFPEQWLWAQKIESASSTFGIGSSHGEQWVFASHYIYTGTGEAFRFTGGTNFILGQNLQVTQGRGLYHSGGSTRFNGFEIDSRGVSGITNFPIQLGGSGLILKGVSVKSSTTTSNAIGAYSAATVGVDGIVSLDRTNSLNVTVAGVSTNYTGSLNVQGSLFLPTGASASKVWTATDSTGLGSWQTASGGSGTPSPLAAAGTNLVADGSIASFFTNAVRSSGLTNIVFTNLVDGQTVRARVYVTNGTTVQLCSAPGVTFAAEWFPSGTATAVNTNGWSEIAVTRFGGFTNISVETPAYDLVFGINSSTNHALRKITITASNAPVMNQGYTRATNGFQFDGVEFSGNSGGGLQLDLSASTRYVLTNANGLNTNLIVYLTNFIPGQFASLTIPANALGTNFDLTVTVAAGSSSTNINWYSPTNGTTTLSAQSNVVYYLSFTVDGGPTKTNINAVWTTTTGNPIRNSVVLLSAGASPSNAVASGILYVSTAAATNLGVTTVTNMGNYTVGAHTLTNNGDTLVAIWRGRTLTGTNQFFFGYGSITNVVDTGSVTNLANGPWEAQMTITRTGNTSQHIDAYVQFGLAGVQWAFTNINTEIAETNGIANLLAMRCASTGGTRPGSTTNNYFSVKFEPANR